MSWTRETDEVIQIHVALQWMFSPVLIVTSSIAVIYQQLQANCVVAIKHFSYKESAKSCLCGFTCNPFSIGQLWQPVSLKCAI